MVISTDQALEKVKDQLELFRSLILKPAHHKLKANPLRGPGRGYKAIYEDYKALIAHHNETTETTRKILLVFVDLLETTIIDIPRSLRSASGT